MPLYEYQCDACGHRFELIQKFSDPPLETCPKCGGHGPQAACRRRRFSSRAPAGTSPTTRRRISGGGRQATSRGSRRPRRDDKARRADKARQGEKSREGRQAARRPTRRAKSDRASARPKRRQRSKSVADLDDRPQRASSADESEPAHALADRRRADRATSRYAENLLGEIGPPQREVDHRLQESELVAGVVADALDLAGVDRPRLQQLAQAVGQLDLARPVALGRRQRGEDVGRQDVAADDRQVGRRLVARRLLDEIAHLVDAVAERARSDRWR